MVVGGNEPIIRSQTFKILTKDTKQNVSYCVGKSNNHIIFFLQNYLYSLFRNIQDNGYWNYKVVEMIYMKVISLLDVYFIKKLIRLACPIKKKIRRIKFWNTVKLSFKITE